MVTAYSPILKLALPVQGELSGTWGDVVNDNITSMVEQAIAGRAVINTWTTDSHTLTTANGTTSESRCAMLELTDTGTALTGAGTVICPTASKIYIVKNAAGQNITVKTAAGTGILVPNGRTTFLFCDGTNVVEALTHTTSLQLGTSTVVTAVLDEDNMASDSDTSLATQQSIKAYVDAQVGANNELSEVLANGNTSGANDIIIDNGQKITVNTIDETTAAAGVTIDSVLLKDDGVNATNLEVTNLKANDGTAAGSIADSTGVVTVASAVLTTADINGGTADDVVIGGTTPAAATVTTVTANTSLNIAGTVTVTSILDEDNMASDDPAGLATQQSIKAYVDAQVGANNELSEVLANGNTTGGTDIAVSTGDDITFAYNSKATFGASADLQVYHDGSHSIIKDAGTGNLYLQGSSSIVLESATTGGNYIVCTDGAAVNLYYDNAVKLSTTANGVQLSDGNLSIQDLTGYAQIEIGGPSGAYIDLKTPYSDDYDARMQYDGNSFFISTNADQPVLLKHNNAEKIRTTSTGIDVTGTVVAEGLTVDAGTGTNVKSTGNNLQFDRDAGASFIDQIGTGSIRLRTTSSFTNRMDVANNGDISFYEDTGTTEKLTWDASDEALEFGDNVKATFGASADLQVFHNSSNNHSYIIESGAGSLITQAENFIVQNTSGVNSILSRSGAEVELFHNGAQKLETTSTGIDVSGTVVADGLTVTDASSSLLSLMEDGSSGADVEYIGASNNFVISTGTSGSGNQTPRLSIQRDSGDISFYEDTGTTAKFFWDASAERLGLGTTAPRAKLHVSGVTGDDDPALGTESAPFFVSNTALSYGLNIGVNNQGDSWLQAQSNSSAVAYDILLNPVGGNVGIGTTSPSEKLDVNGTAKATTFEVNGWTITESGGSLYFATGGTNKMKLDASGNLDVVGSVNSNATIT